MTTPLIDETETLKKLENAIFARYKDLNADVFSAEIYHTIIEPLYETPLYQGTGGHNYIQDEENEENEDTTNGENTRIALIKEYCDRCERVTGTDYTTGQCGGCMMRAFFESQEQPTLLARLKAFVGL